MNKITFLILILIAHVSFAQTENPENKMAADSFFEYYNAEKYDEIFLMFSSEMKSALPLDKTTEFLKGLKSQVGKINHYTFMSYKNGSYAFYKSEFEQAVLAVNISVDHNSKINGLFVEPFVEETQEKKARKNLISDNSTNKMQSDLIFEHTKSFPDQTQLALALIKNGKVTYFGIKRSNNEIIRTHNSSSIFEIGSVSKVFTATLLSGFVVNNKLNLNDHINDYLGFDLKNNVELTFKQLANHTSGLPRLPSNLDLSSVDPSNPYKDYGVTELVNYLKENLEISENIYDYSNLGFGLLGYVLVKHSNSSYNELLQKSIFNKYNMSHSTALIAKVKNPLVIGLDKDGKETSHWDLSVLEGAGGIFSNVEDMAKFALAQFEDSNIDLKLTRQKTSKVNESMDIGLGWHILNDMSKNNWYWHNGGTGGYSSTMVIDTTNRNGVIILSNVSAFNPHMSQIDNLGFALMKSID